MGKKDVFKVSALQSLYLTINCIIQGRSQGIEIINSILSILSYAGNVTIQEMGTIDSITDLRSNTFTTIGCSLVNISERLRAEVLFKCLIKTLRQYRSRLCR